MSTAATQAGASTAPELLELVRLAVEELSGDGLVVVDSRGGRDRIVACEGRGTELMGEGGRAVPPAVDPAVGCAVVDLGDLHVISASMEIDRADRIGTLHVVFCGPARAHDEQVMRLTRVFARHAALSIAYGSLRHERERTVELARLSAPEPLMGSAHTLEDITGVIAEVMRPLTGATAAAITLWDEARDILRALPGAFGAREGRLRASMTGPSSNPVSVACRVFNTGRPYMTNHACEDPGLHQAYVRVFDIERILAVPLVRGAHRTGAFMLVNKPTHFTLGDVAVAEALAPRVALAVELATSVSQLRVQQRLEGILADAAVAVAASRPVGECLLPAFQELCEVMEATMVALVPRASGPPLAWRAATAPRALEQRFMSDARSLVDGSVGAYPQAVGDPGWAALHVPVELDGERKAALSVLRRNGQPLLVHETQVVGRLANIAALAWATERYQHQLAEIARLHERERIADALHDRVAQILFAAQLGLDSILEGNPEASVDRQRLLEVRGLLTRGDGAIRDVITELAVPVETPVARRLRLEVESFEETFGIAVHLELPDDAEIDGVPRPVADCLVKIAREAMVNAAKHAGPCRISVSLGGQARTGLVLTVVDDGLGPCAAAQDGDRRGLRSLRQAADDVGGTLEIAPAAGMFGTRLTAAFPPAD